MALKSFVILVTLLVSCITTFYFLRRKPVSDLPMAAKMVGSRRTAIINFPHHAQYGPHCNGAIISQWWMIAPAHCPEYANAIIGSACRDRNQRFYNSAINILPDRKLIRITKRIVHPRYGNPNNSHELEYDFQLMKFNKMISSIKCAAPIALSLAPKRRFDRDSWFLVTGFSDTDHDEFMPEDLTLTDPPDAWYLADVFVTPPPVKISTVLWNSRKGYEYRSLHQIVIKRQDDSSCAGPAHGFKHRNITRNLMCAGLPYGNADGCKDDVGGGMLFEGSLVGLLLRGRGCHQPDEKILRTGIGSDKKRFSVYGLIYPVLDWIKTVTKVGVTYKEPPTFKDTFLKLTD